MYLSALPEVIARARVLLMALHESSISLSSWRAIKQTQKHRSVAKKALTSGLPVTMFGVDK